MTTLTHPKYGAIWFTLVVLLGISLLGPLTGSTAFVLLLAFGIAVVKAGMVAAWFMHLAVERRLIWFLMITALALMAVLFFGVAPDVMRDQGQNWGALAAGKN